MIRKKQSSALTKLPVATDVIERSILVARSRKVMLDSDLARLYGVTTFNLNKSVKRNLDRFPPDFMFRLMGAEVHDLRFQIGISNSAGRGGRRYLPYVFTEQGVAMLSSVLRSKRAVQVNIAIMRAFVKLREVVAIQRGLIRRVDEMESRNEDRFRFLFDAIRKRPSPDRPPRRIGFVAAGPK